MSDQGGGRAKEQPQINWGAVMLATAVLVLVSVVISNLVVRTLLLAILFLWAFSLIRPTTPEAEIEDPMLDKLREPGQGLDRRKYGRLRAYTERLLEHTRAMNRFAIDSRQGRTTLKHANAEMDRLADMMRSVVAEMRKAAGVPTPMAEVTAKPQQQVVHPSKSKKEAPADEAAKEPEPVDASAIEPDLDALEAAAVASAQSRVAEHEAGRIGGGGEEGAEGEAGEPEESEAVAVESASDEGPEVAEEEAEKTEPVAAADGDGAPAAPKRKKKRKRKKKKTKKKAKK